MANYLILHYKGIYRLKAPIDENTGQFPRDYKGEYSDNDVYIECQKGKVFHYGNQILQFYTSSLGKGHNIIKAIQSNLGKEIISNIEETDSEVLFRFHSKHMKDLEKYLKPKTSGATISPFSVKNLPKSDYRIPNKDLDVYNKIVEKIPKELKLNIGHISKKFIISIGKYEDFKKMNMKQKEYLHSIDEWDNYIQYLKENVI